jgi:hypothetical protein
MFLRFAVALRKVRVLQTFQEQLGKAEDCSPITFRHLFEGLVDILNVICRKQFRPIDVLPSKFEYLPEMVCSANNLGWRDIWLWTSLAFTMRQALFMGFWGLRRNK